MLDMRRDCEKEEEDVVGKVHEYVEKGRGMW